MQVEIFASSLSLVGILNSSSFDQINTLNKIIISKVPEIENAFVLIIK